MTLESRVAEWVHTRIGIEHMHPRERAMRLLEEAVELAPTDFVLSDRQEGYAWRIAYIYRRQLPKAVAEEADRRKVNHQWKFEGDLERCWVCGLYSPPLRNRNAPCPGPPKPKTPRKRRSTAQGAVAVAKSPIDAPTLFDTTSEVEPGAGLTPRGHATPARDQALKEPVT